MVQAVPSHKDKGALDNLDMRPKPIMSALYLWWWCYLRFKAT